MKKPVNAASKKTVAAALKAVKSYARSTGTAPADFEHIPLHYSIADLVAGLVWLADEKGLDFDAINRDARELLYKKEVVD